MTRARSILGILLALTAIVAWAALEQVRVVEREARVRAEQRKFGEALLVVHEGEALDLVSTSPPWVRVRKGNVEGWLHESAVTRDKGYKFSVASLGGTQVEASERTAGQKGFDATTETSFRASKPALQGAYARVDAIDAARPDESQVARFMSAGKLAGGGR
jgi:hypothetical protein